MFFSFAGVDHGSANPTCLLVSVLRSLRGALLKFSGSRPREMICAVPERPCTPTPQQVRNEVTGIPLKPVRSQSVPRDRSHLGTLSSRYIVAGGEVTTSPLFTLLPFPNLSLPSLVTVIQPVVVAQ